MSSPRLLQQLVSYGIIGCVCSGVDTLVFTILVTVFPDYVLAINVASVSLGITMSFFLNRRYTFKITDHTVRRYCLFFGVGMCGLVLSELIILAADCIGISVFIAKIASVFIVAVFQFILNKLISFRPEI